VKQRTLGSTGFSSSAIGLGCMGFSQGYGPTADSESVAAIRSALDLGITMVDTAMSYGAGHNERLVARALAGQQTGTGRVAIATKFGIVREGDRVRVDAHPDRIRSYCEGSLRRLGVDVIDLYYLHRVDPSLPLADTVGAMAELVAEGKVRHLGLSEVTPDELAQAAAVHPIAAVQFEWSLLWREPENDIVPAARALGVGVVAYSPLGRGLLTATLDRAAVATTDYRGSDPRFQGETLDRNLHQVDVLRSAAADLGLTPAQLALAWLLAQGTDVVPIPGSRRPARIAENAQAAEVHLSQADLTRLDALLPAAAWAGDRRSFAARATTRTAAAAHEPGRDDH
jgi:aryl-alcohol dehydrogenase-like predicted oxidoreductase